jgi:hypothetical protein
LPLLSLRASIKGFTGFPSDANTHAVIASAFVLNSDLSDWLRLSPSCLAEANKFASALASCVDLLISMIPFG